MDKPKLYISAAFLCEKVLQEKDGVLTAVRILDKMTFQLPPGGLPEGAKPAIAMTGLVGLKSGPTVGEFTLKVGVTRPNGEKKHDVITFPVSLLGGEQGQNFIINIGLGIEEDGLHWFDVMLDDELLTRIPLVVTSEQIQPVRG